MRSKEVELQELERRQMELRLQLEDAKSDPYFNPQNLIFELEYIEDQIYMLENE